jgi:hypothetical protein
MDQEIKIEIEQEQEQEKMKWFGRQNLDSDHGDTAFQKTDHLEDSETSTLTT